MGHPIELQLQNGSAMSRMQLQHGSAMSRLHGCRCGMAAAIAENGSYKKENEKRMGDHALFSYVGNIARDISGIKRKPTVATAED